MDKTKDGKYFTKLDIRWGYNNVWIKEGDEWKAAFKMNWGLFEPTVIFFRMCNSLATFQAMMDNIFQDLIEEGIVIIYMDDMFLSAKNKDRLQENTRRVLQRLMENDLYLKPKKCEFCKEKIEWLGMVIQEGKIMMDPGKLRGIQDNHSETSMGLPGIQELLPAIHPWFLRACPTSKRAPEKRPKIRVDNWMPTGLRRPENQVYQWAGVNHAGPDKTLPNWVRHIQVCLQSGVNPVRLKRGSPLVCLHLKDVLTNGEKLQDLRPGAAGHYSSLRGVEALHPRVDAYNHRLLRPQELDILPRSKEAELTTGKMVPLSVRIWHQTGPHIWNKSGTIRCTVPMARLHSRRRHG